MHVLARVHAGFYTWARELLGQFTRYIDQEIGLQDLDQNLDQVRHALQ
jgi:hypothetical protein